MNLLSLLQISTETWGTFASVLGVIITVIFASIGISKIAKTALEGTARQPEAGNDLRTSMIISAALIEGIALFAIVVCGFIL